MDIRETVRAQEMIYKAVVQTVLLYVSDSWIVKEETLKVLEGFHHRVDQKISGIPSWRVGEEVRKWALAEKEL